MQSSPRPDVLIIGAGPAGLTLAAALVARQISVCIIESTPKLSTQWRASTFHPPTLEMLQELGLAEEMISRGLVAQKYQIRDRTSGLIAEFDLQEIRDETPFPFRLQLEQYKYSQMILNRLQGNPLFKIFWGRSATSVEETDAGVVALARGTDGTDVQYHGRYAIGADGAKSQVRKSLGIGFEGMTYPVRFLILSTTYDFMDHFDDLALVNYVWDPEEPFMLLRIPDVWRVMFSLKAEEAQGDILDASSIQGRLRRIVGEGDSHRTFPVSDAQYYSVHQRVSDTFRVGRVILIGDAAHINSPVGGLGLNSGIHDAIDLAIRLEQVLRGGRSDSVLDDFAAVRRRVALDVIQRVTDRNTRQMLEDSGEVRRANRFELAGVARDPVARREWMLESAMITAVREYGIGSALRA